MHCHWRTFRRMNWGFFPMMSISWLKFQGKLHRNPCCGIGEEKGSCDTVHFNNCITLSAFSCSAKCTTVLSAPFSTALALTRHFKVFVNEIVFACSLRIFYIPRPVLKTVQIRRRPHICTADFSYPDLLLSNCFYGKCAG